MKNPTNYAAKLERFKLLVKSVDSLRTELEELAGRVIDADRGAWRMVFGEERDRSATTPSEPYYLTRADYFTITDEGVVECYVSGKYGGEDSVINEFSFPPTHAGR